MFLLSFCFYRLRTAGAQRRWRAAVVELFVGAYGRFREAHAVDGAVLSGRRVYVPLSEQPGLLQQPAPHGDDGGIAGAKVLLVAIDDGTHAFLDGHVLRLYACDAGERSVLLEGAVDEVVILHVAHREEGVGDGRAREILRALDILSGEGALIVPRDHDRPGVMVVYRSPGDALAVDAGLCGALLEEVVERHHPVGEAPVVRALADVTARSDAQAIVRILRKEDGRTVERVVAGAQVVGSASALQPCGGASECVHGGVEEVGMRRIDAAFEPLHPVRPFEALGYVYVRKGHVEPREVRHGGHARGRAEVCPDKAAPLRDGVGGLANLLHVVARCGLRGHVHALAFHVELPAVVYAAQAGFLVASEEEARAAVRAAFGEQSDATVGIAEGDKVLAEQANADGRTVGFREFVGEEERNPEAA